MPCLAAALLLTTLTHGQNPAIKVIFTDAGLQYVRYVGSEWLQDNFGSICLPDIDGEVSLSIFGDVYFSLVNMKVTDINFPVTSVQFCEDVSGFKAFVSVVHLSVAGDWSTSYGIIEDSGDFDLVVTGAQVEAAVALGVDARGMPTFQSAACRARVDSASMQFHGGGSWIFQPFVEKYEEYIRNTIEEQICPALQEGLETLQSQLPAIATFPVNQVLAVDLPLTSMPVVSSSSLSLSLKGLFHSLDSHETPPFEAQPFCLAEEPGYMLSLGLSQYTVNSAAYAYYTSGKLQALITDDMIPPRSPLHLNTDSFGIFIPQLRKMYPGMEMKLQLYASEAPEVDFKPGAVKMNLLGSVKAFAIQADGTAIPLFKLNVESTFTGKFYMATEKLTGSVAMDNFTLTLADSEVGPFKTTSLETIIALGIKVSGLPTVNAKLAKGIDLPTMQQVQLTNLVLNVEEGFISVLSDAEIQPMGDSYNA